MPVSLSCPHRSAHNKTNSISIKHTTQTTKQTKRAISKQIFSLSISNRKLTFHPLLLNLQSVFFPHHQQSPCRTTFLLTTQHTPAPICRKKQRTTCIHARDFSIQIHFTQLSQIHPMFSTPSLSLFHLYFHDFFTPLSH